MTPYRDINGDCGILAYECGIDWISVQFKSGSVYTYRSSRVGAANLATMLQLAVAGDGLNAFINTTPVVKNG
jgi:hypothetical protein